MSQIGQIAIPGQTDGHNQPNITNRADCHTQPNFTNGEDCHTQPETKKSTALQEAIGVIQENLGLEKEIPKNPLGGSYQILLLLRQYFPDVMKFKTTCPHMTCLVKDNIWEVQKLIPHVNDRHKWNREQIADWIETLDVDITIKQSKS